MEEYILVNIKTGKKKVLGHILILMEEFIKEIGKKGNKKEKECFIYQKKKLGKKDKNT